MRHKILLLDTSFARENGLEQTLKGAFRYLIDNREVALSPLDTNTLYSTKMYSKSPTTVIFENMLADGLLSEYCLIDTGLTSQSVPELFALTDFTLDLKQLTAASMILGSMKEFQNKILINVAPLIQRSREGMIKLTNINELHNEIVRGALVTSYYNCSGDIWLNPPLLKYIAESYSMCISGVLQRIYQLDLNSQLTIATALSWFILNRMTDTPDEILMQCSYLGSRLQIRQTLDMFKETVDDMDTFDLNRLCALIAIIGPQHMKNFNKDIFLRTMIRSGSSFISMSIALEYPPYWVQQVLFALSGNRVYLNTLLQRAKLLKTAGMFLQQLTVCRQFLPTVKYVSAGVANLNTITIKSLNIGTKQKPLITKMLYDPNLSGCLAIDLKSIDYPIILENNGVQDFTVKQEKAFRLLTSHTEEALHTLNGKLYLKKAFKQDNIDIGNIENYNIKGRVESVCIYATGMMKIQWNVNIFNQNHSHSTQLLEIVDTEGLNIAIDVSEDDPKIIEGGTESLKIPRTAFSSFELIDKNFSVDVSKIDMEKIKK